MVRFTSGIGKTVVVVQFRSRDAQVGQKQKSDLSQGRVNGSSERVDTAPDLALWSEAVQQAYEAGRAVAL